MSRRLVRTRAAIAVAAVLLGGCTRGATGHAGTTAPAATRHTSTAPSSTAAATSSATPAAQQTCPDSARMSVSTSGALTQALAHASPGTVISLAAGVYRGDFVTSASGTAAAPITLCGPRSAILDGGDIAHGYVLHLNAASWWIVTGLTVQNGQKGIVTDHAEHDVLSGLNVHSIGDEGIHLRDFSSDNTVRGNVIADTGQHDGKFGEGIYVGTANKNWCKISNCQPDRSDRNLLQANTISRTTAENIDIKEGTTGGVITGNQLSGIGMLDSAATGWINVKGNGWTITGNTGADSLKDGFQVHEVYPGWGEGNVFHANHATVNGPGFAFYVQHASLQTIITCDNTATAAGSGLSNIACSSQ